MEFVDIHIHALSGVDDGPKSKSEMFQMLDASYADGVRHLCLTPHSHPGYFGNNHEKAAARFEELKTYAAEKYRDLNLYLGSELRFSDRAQDWLEQGICRSLNGSCYVLVDFDFMEERGRIVKGLHRLLNAGYKPVLAHAERYIHLDVKTVRELKVHDVTIQVNVSNLTRWGFGAPYRAWKLLYAHLADVVASDAHRPKKGSLGLMRGYQKTCLHLGRNYADKLFCENPLKLLQGGNR